MWLVDLCSGCQGSSVYCWYVPWGYHYGSHRQNGRRTGEFRMFVWFLSLFALLEYPKTPIWSRILTKGSPCNLQKTMGEQQDRVSVVEIFCIQPKESWWKFWEVLRSFFKKLKIGVRYDAELELPKKRRSAAELARTENKPGFRLVHRGWGVKIKASKFLQSLNLFWLWSGPTYSVWLANFINNVSLLLQSNLLRYQRRKCFIRL